MKYFVCYKGEDDAKEITKEEARSRLSGYWNKRFLDSLFENEIGFRLYTPASDIWTQDKGGRIPIAGYYGTVGDFEWYEE